MMKKRNMYATGLLGLLLLAFTLGRSQPPANYVEKIIPAVGTRAGVVMYTPQVWEANKKYPVLFVLHGIGEKGNGSKAALTKLANHVNYFAAEKFGAQYGFIIVEPQTDNNWEHGEVDEAYQLLKDSLANYINWKQVALTGQSLGGGGVYQYLSTHTDAATKFSAAVPNDAGPYQFFVTEKNVSNVLNTAVPMWAFHNQGDTTVTPAQSTLFFFEKWQALKGRAKMWVSIIDLNNHTFPAYNRGRGNTLTDGFKYVSGNGYTINPGCNLYEWILMQEIGKPAVAPPPLLVFEPGVLDTTKSNTLSGVDSIVASGSNKDTATAAARKILGYNLTGKNLVMQIVYANGEKRYVVLPAETGSQNIWIPFSAPARPTYSSKSAGAYILDTK